MIPPPGFSVSELIQGIIAARNIYQVFFDEDSGAVARIAEIEATLTFLENILKQVQAIVVHYRLAFPSEVALKRKLHESEKFLKDYCELTPQSLADPSSRNVLRRVRRLGQTAHFAAFERDADRLNAGFSIEMQKLMAWIFVSGW